MGGRYSQRIANNYRRLPLTRGMTGTISAKTSEADGRRILTHRAVYPLDMAHTARYDDDTPPRRSIVEAVLFPHKQRCSDTLLARTGVEQFRELDLYAAVGTVERASSLRSVQSADRTLCSLRRISWKRYMCVLSCIRRSCMENLHRLLAFSTHRESSRCDIPF